MPTRAAPCCLALMLSTALLASGTLLAQEPPSGGAAAADPRAKQLEIASAKFKEALAAVREAHRLMPIAVEKSVIFEETKDNRKSQPCEDALAGAKTDSSRARKDFNEARGKASSAFEGAKRAVQELRRLGPDPSGASPLDQLPFAADVDVISASLKALDTKLFKRVNSSLSTKQRALLWRDTNEYVAKLPGSWDVPKASSLVPGSVSIPCTGRSVNMHVMPED